MGDPNASLNKVRKLDEAGLQKWLQERRVKWWGWRVNEQGETVLDENKVNPSLELFTRQVTALFKTAKDDSEHLSARQRAADQLLRYDLKEVYFSLDEYKDFYADALKSRRRMDSLLQPSSASSKFTLPDDPVNGWANLNQAIRKFQDVRDASKEPVQSLDRHGRYNPYRSFMATATNEQRTVAEQVKGEFCALHVDGTIAANEAINYCYAKPEVTSTIDDILDRSSHTGGSGLASELGGMTIGSSDDDSVAGYVNLCHVYV